MIKYCLFCKQRLLSNASTVTCEICHEKCNTRCISLANQELSTIMSIEDCWYCRSCLSSVLPFVHIQDESEFQDDICVKDSFAPYWDSFSEKVFNPLTWKYKEIDLPLDDLDLDNDIAYYSSTLCKYYTDGGFLKDFTVSPMDDEKTFSLCHFNVRSLQSNSNSLSSYLSTLEFGFTAVGVTEACYMISTVICIVYRDIFSLKTTEHTDQGEELEFI